MTVALPFARLTVIGAGLIGGSLLMAARSMFADLWIQAVDPSAEALQTAVANRLTDKVSLALPDTFEDDHLVVLACHLSAAMEELPRLAARVAGRDVTVIDIGSCKRAICALGAELLPGQFIGAHPMAGKERSGIAHATALLFASKPFLLCPPANLAEKPELQRRLALLRAFVERMGAVPREIDPETHDRYMAYVSHLPQLYAVLLANLLYRHEPGRLLALHGGGIDDQMRLAASPYVMWGDVFSQNADNLRGILAELGGMLTEAAENLDGPGLALWFERANRIHQDFQALKAGRPQSQNSPTTPPIIMPY